MNRFRYPKIIIALLVIVILASLFTMQTVVSGAACNNANFQGKSIDIYDTLDNSDWQFLARDISHSNQREFTDNRTRGNTFTHSIRNINIYLLIAVFFVYLLKNQEFRYSLCDCFSYILKKSKFISNIHDKDGKKRYTFAF